MPRNRGKIVTAVRETSKLPEVLTFLRSHLEAGRQLYVVYPLIEESEKADVKAAAVEYERWRERLHPFSCELLHGRVPGIDKQEIMERFRRGETQVLISTTVIEVGVDVPNATVMLVENAERFGLAQLHQLRGRIGRAEHASTCILFDESTEEQLEARARLEAMARTTDGFELADEDLRLRGEGTLFDVRQAGLPDLKLARLAEDLELVKRARARAFEVVEQ